MMEDVPVDGDTVVTGHAIGPSVRRTANVWHTDTGAGLPSGKLTIARIDADSITTVTLDVVRNERSSR